MSAVKAPARPSMHLRPRFEGLGITGGISDPIRVLQPVSRAADQRLGRDDVVSEGIEHINAAHLHNAGVHTFEDTAAAGCVSGRELETERESTKATEMNHPRETSGYCGSGTYS